MTKRASILLTILVLVATYCYAQARNPAYNLEGKTNFANLGLSGTGNTGNPGYIELRAIPDNAANSTDAKETYYLWVSESGRLCMASYTTISTYASFPTGDWRSGTYNGVTSTWPCTVVGDRKSVV